MRGIGRFATLWLNLKVIEFLFSSLGIFNGSVLYLQFIGISMLVSYIFEISY